MDITAYLSRIRYSGPLEPTPEVLAALQRAHLFSVPFENLDIHLGRPIRLEEDALFDKIVVHRRGGFCYELNGLFSRLLAGLGYQLTLFNARGVNDDGSYSREYDHLALSVCSPLDPGARYLVDVGWGNGPLEPLRLDDPGDQPQDERLFRFTEQNGYQVLLERVTGEDGSQRWISHYAFTRRPCAYDEFLDCCRYHQTAPESMFTQKRLCTLYLPDGRVTLSNLRLITTRAGGREERDLPGEPEFRQALADYFDIVL